MTVAATNRAFSGGPFFFDAPPAGDLAGLRALLGGKGAGLTEMAAHLQLPVPPGFILPTTLCHEVAAGAWPSGLTDLLRAAVGRLESLTGKRFGAAIDPLLLSVRSGAAQSMPGMLDTILNLGATPSSIEALARTSGQPKFAADCYARFLRMFGATVLQIPAGRFDAAPGLGEAAVDRAVRHRDVVLGQLGADQLDDPWNQLRLAVEAVFRSWYNDRARLYRARQGISDALGTAVTIQTMVFGNLDDRSGSGVYFTRDPNTGAPTPYGDYLARAQGEDVVAGTHATATIADFAREHPQVYRDLLEAGRRLERHLLDMCDIEFTVERGRLWLLQVRAGKRSAVAAIRIAMDLGSDESLPLGMAQALARLEPDVVAAAEAASTQAAPRAEPIARGLGASPGFATGRAFFSADAAEAAAERGEDVIFVAVATSPSDLHGFQAARGVLTCAGGLVSHAALVAREWGIPGVVGAGGISVGSVSFSVGEVTVREGDVISLDGSAGSVFLGNPGSGTGASNGSSVLARQLRVCCDRLLGPHPELGLQDLLERVRQLVRDRESALRAAPF